MSKVYLEDSVLTDIADAIREKTGESGTITPADMASEINDITTGGTIESLNILANGTYTAPEGIDGYSPIVVNVAGGIDLTNVYKDFLFYKGRFLDLLSPSDLEIPSNKSLGTGKGIFAEINNPGKNIPDIKIIGSSNFGQWYGDMTSVFSGTGWQNIPKFEFEETVGHTQNSSGGLPQIWKFSDKYLDRIPSHVVDFFIYFKQKIQSGVPQWTSNSVGNICFDCYVKDATDFFQRYRWSDNATFNYSYGNQSYYCRVLLTPTYSNKNVFFLTKYLDGVYDLQVIGKNTEAKTNMFQDNSSAIANMALGGMTGNTWKDFMFEMQDENTPYTAMWQKQIILIGSNNRDYGVGMGPTASQLGIPRVTNDEEYELYKNQVYTCGGFSSALPYARYNHDSAVRTIKSLPDCSAYLTSSGGTTNQIRFYQPTQGSATDGGAIDTLTAEEIAVATAKGWTVIMS